MSLKKELLLFFVLLLSTTQSFSQDNELLETQPVTKEEFVKSEPQVINIVDWIENTPLDQEVEKRKLLYARFLAWLTNSPTVTVNIDEHMTTFVKKNPDLLFIFMCGWTKYSLENAYSKDDVKCTQAGIKSAILVYQMGNGIKKDKAMEKIVEMDSKNELEAWITSQLAKH